MTHDPNATPPRRRTVLLEHRLPDGSAHVDWLVAARSPPSQDARCVWTWRIGEPTDGPSGPTGGRLVCRLDRLTPGSSVSGRRLPDHRALYLHHEGRVGPETPLDRGTVRRLAVGSAMFETASTVPLTLRVDWRDRDGGGEVISMRLQIVEPPAADDDTTICRTIITRLDRSPSEFPRRQS